MKLRVFAVLAAGLLMGADAPQDSASKDVEKALRALNEAFKNRDADAIQRLMTDNHVAITPYYRGPRTKAEQLKNLPDLKMTEYTMGAVKVTLISKDIALITYPLTMKGTYQGKELAPKNYASAVWVLQNGKWLEASYQETAIDGK
jgi:ketosteroid isomerase-like protein